MPRIPRNKLQATYFHVIVQGINKEYIFNNEKNIKKYLTLLFNNLYKYDVTLISYCIMNNHAHILLNVDQPKILSQYMKSVNTSYAKYYNRIENRVGIVFRNRFESEPIYTEKYLFNCIAYIHNNPVKASIVKSPQNYPYSSYNDYLNSNGIINKSTITFLFGNKQNYLDIFKRIHLSNETFKDYIEDVDYTNINDYLNTLDIKNILSDTNKLKKLLHELISKYKVPITKISEILQINRFKIYRILNKD